MPEAARPSHASVAVIGGGDMGCSTLYHLARAGVSDAVLLERSDLTSGATWRSAAQVRALRSTRNLTDLSRYSILPLHGARRGDREGDRLARRLAAVAGTDQGDRRVLNQGGGAGPV